MQSTTDSLPILNALKFETDPFSLFAFATRKQTVKSVAKLNSTGSGLKQGPKSSLIQSQEAISLPAKGLGRPQWGKALLSAILHTNAPLHFYFPTLIFSSNFLISLANLFISLAPFGKLLEFLFEMRWAIDT